jgi:hypothetical protein
VNIYEKLSKIQIELKAPKGQYNSFGKYKYRSCEDIQESIKPLLSENKCVLVISDILVQVGDRYYIQATAIFIDTETTERIENTAFAREEETKKGMDGSQITGATSSYARKYALNGLFCIDDTKDSDSTNTHDKEPTAPNFNTITTAMNATQKASELNKDPLPFSEVEQNYACVDCGNPFVDIEVNGKKMTAKEVYDKSYLVNGRAICRHCKEQSK